MSARPGAAVAPVLTRMLSLAEKFPALEWAITQALYLNWSKAPAFSLQFWSGLVQKSLVPGRSIPPQTM